MDMVVKKSNKENSKTEVGPKKNESRNFISKQKLTRPVPLRSKNELREENGGDKSESKAQVKPSKPAKSNNSDPMQRKTLSQAFRTEQTLRHRKLVLETQKPPSSVPPKPLLPGTYKGRVVQSKIDCFRKPSSGHEKNPSENKTKVETVVRSKSATTLSMSSRAGVQSGVASRMKSGSDAGVNMQKTVPQRRIQMKAPARTATVSAKPSMVSAKPSTVSAKPSTVSAKPSTLSSKPSTLSSKPSTLSSKPSTISRKPVTMSARPPTVTSFIKKKEPSKPAAAASEQKPQKSASSSISHYRVHVESAEERRVKLAGWLASKGKTLKRPAMTETSAPQTCKPQLHTEEGDGAPPEASKRAEAVTVSKAEQSQVPQWKPAFSNSPSHILNTTLELLDNSDTELQAEPEIKMESLVINLCERLEAMETPSSCRSDTKAGGSSDAEVNVGETVEYEILEEEELSEEEPTHTAGVEEDDGEEKKTSNIKEEEEKKLYEGEEKKKPYEGEEEEEEEKKPYEGDEEEEEEKMDSTPADILDACVVKYSVKTTPFLQSVKKRMEGEMAPATPGSRCKSSIKELKFLTPVRRSSRIHRNSSRLPDMLNEHDPCVSSLAELELLDAADSNAYIYRKNPALLQHLPDQRPEPQSPDRTCK
uniref:Cytoskeleton-associated protein 2 n=1 Tax=Ictalurus punctatus TaxID=7998 RepID=W5UEV8_ICTPU